MLATRRPGRDGLQEVHRSVGTSILQQGLVRLIFHPTVAKCDDVRRSETADASATPIGFISIFLYYDRYLYIHGL